MVGQTLKVVSSRSELQTCCQISTPVELSILHTFEQEGEIASVGTSDAKLPRPLLGTDDIQRGVYRMDFHNRLIWVVCPRHRELQIRAFKQLRRALLQL